MTPSSAPRTLIHRAQRHGDMQECHRKSAFQKCWNSDAIYTNVITFPRNHVPWRAVLGSQRKIPRFTAKSRGYQIFQEFLELWGCATFTAHYQNTGVFQRAIPHHSQFQELLEFMAPFWYWFWNWRRMPEFWQNSVQDAVIWDKIHFIISGKQLFYSIMACIIMAQSVLQSIKKAINFTVKAQGLQSWTFCGRAGWRKDNKKKARGTFYSQISVE